jgi:AcrR family transcriptional regulator
MAARTQLGRPVGASGEETRRRIIVATMKCVAEVGYAKSTIREIARVADVTSSSLYNYFPTKSALMEAAVAARTDMAMPRLRRAADGPGDIVDRIEAVLDECGQLMREYPDLAAFEFAIRAEPVVAPYRGKTRGEPDNSGFEALREIIEKVVGDASERGELGDHPDARAVVAAIYALVYGLTELAATLPAADYHAALNSAKVLVRGALFGGQSASP